MRTILWFLPIVLCLFGSLNESESSPSPARSALRILVISDLNAAYGDTTYSEEVKQIIARLPSLKPDLILCGGDMVAGQKASLTEAQLTAMWNGFTRNVFAPIVVQGIPFGFTLGNHDASPGFKMDRAIAESYWLKNKTNTRLNWVNATHFPFYYSFQLEHVFFISWDAAASKLPEEQLAWMKSQLNSRAAKNASLRIVLGHLPLYAIVAAKNKPGEVLHEADQLASFFKEHRVDLYISGHQHAYFPSEKEGVSLLHLGCIGNGPRPLLGHDQAAQKTYSILEIPLHKKGTFHHQAYAAITHEAIADSLLPDSVSGFNGLSRKANFKK